MRNVPQFIMFLKINIHTNYCNMRFGERFKPINKTLSEFEIYVHCDIKTSPGFIIIMKISLKNDDIL